MSLHVACLFFPLTQSLSCCDLHWHSTGWIQWGCTRPSIRFLTRLCMNTSCCLWLSDRKICCAEHIASQLSAGLPHWGCISLPWKSVVFSCAPLMHTSPVFLLQTTTGKGRWRPDKSRRGSCFLWLHAGSHISLGFVGQEGMWMHLWLCDRMVFYIQQSQKKGWLGCISPFLSFSWHFKL